MYRLLFFMPVLLVGMLLAQRSNKFLQCEEFDSFVVNSSVFDLIDPLDIDVESEECKFNVFAECFFDDLKNSKILFILKAQTLAFVIEINAIIFHSDVSPPIK